MFFTDDDSLDEDLRKIDEHDMKSMSFGAKRSANFKGEDNIIPNEHYEIAEEFFHKFVVVSESSQSGHVDIALALKAMPARINM